MTDGDDIKRRLAEAGQRLANADAARKEALEDIGAAMRDGKGTIDIKQMAELAGVTRVTAYRLIGD